MNPVSIAVVRPVPPPSPIGALQPLYSLPDKGQSLHFLNYSCNGLSLISRVQFLGSCQFYIYYLALQSVSLYICTYFHHQANKKNYFNCIYIHCTCTFALFVCLTLLASFFLPSHLSFKNMYMYALPSQSEVITALPKFIKLSPNLVKSVFDRLLLSYKGIHYIRL